MTDVNKPLTQTDTQTVQQQQQTQQPQAQQTQQAQQQTGQQAQQQAQQQQPLQQPPQPPQQQPLNILPTPYQQQPYHTGSAPHSPQPGYAQMAPPSPLGGFYPPQGYVPPPQGYQYSPQQYLPPQGYAYSPQSGYPPPQPGYPPQGAPFQQYPPQQGYPQPGYPPQPGYLPQPGYPPQPCYLQQYPQQPIYDRSNQWPQVGQFGPILKPVSDGYTPGVFAPNYHPRQDAEVIRKALSAGVLTDEDALIHILPFLTPTQLESIRHCLFTENQIVLSELVDKKMTSTFKDAVRAVVLGPLEFDVWLLNRAMEGLGTKEVFLDMVLLGRKNGDIDAIKEGYFRKYKKHLFDVIRSELSGEVEALFTNALESRRADESAPINDAQIEVDVKDLYTAMVGKSEGNKVSEILVTRSDAQIKRIIEVYERKYKGKTLEEVVKKKFKSHMEDALLYILQGAQNKPLRDAKLLEKTMKGFGTKDEELAYRLAMLHWDKAHFGLVKAAYKAEFPKRVSLTARVKDETSGDQQKFLVALLEV